MSVHNGPLKPLWITSHFITINTTPFCVAIPESAIHLPALSIIMEIAASTEQKAAMLAVLLIRLVSNLYPPHDPTLHRDYLIPSEANVEAGNLVAEMNIPLDLFKTICKATVNVQLELRHLVYCLVRGGLSKVRVPASERTKIADKINDVVGIVLSRLPRTDNPTQPINDNFWISLSLDVGLNATLAPAVDVVQCFFLTEDDLADFIAHSVNFVNWLSLYIEDRIPVDMGPTDSAPGQDVSGNEFLNDDFLSDTFLTDDLLDHDFLNDNFLAENIVSDDFLAGDTSHDDFLNNSPLETNTTGNDVLDDSLSGITIVGESILHGHAYNGNVQGGNDTSDNNAGGDTPGDHPASSSTLGDNVPSGDVSGDDDSDNNVRDNVDPDDDAYFDWSQIDTPWGVDWDGV